MPATSDRPLVTFAVIAYNQERFIREAIEGAFAQTYQPLEIILSDDASPDRTYEIMEEMAAAYDGPHKVVLNRNEPNLGLVGHIDRVMELVSGEFIVVNAGDDVSVPERTEKLSQKWLASKRMAKLVHSPAMKVDETGRFLGVRTSPQPVLDDPTPYTIAAGCHHILGATLGWDRAVFDIFGSLGKGISNEDHIIPFRASLIGDISYIQEPLVKHRIGGVSGTRANKGPAYEYLYGLSHKVRKWRSDVDIYILERFRDISYPRKLEAEAICRARGPVLRFAVDLAETGRLRRWAMALKAVSLALRHRTPTPLKDWARYTFETIYLHYADWRLARRDKGTDNTFETEISSK